MNKIVNPIKTNASKNPLDLEINASIVIIMAIVLVTFGLTMLIKNSLNAIKNEGRQLGIKETRVQAVEAGVGQWIVTNSVGDLGFEWITRDNK